MDPFWVLESNDCGFKVVYCEDGQPQGGRTNANYLILADGLNRKEATEMVQRLRRG